MSIGDEGMPPDAGEFAGEAQQPQPQQQPPGGSVPREFPDYTRNAKAVLEAIESYLWPEWAEHRIEPVVVGYKVMVGRAGEIKTLVVGIPFAPDEQSDPPEVERVHDFLAESCEYLIRGPGG